MTAEQTTAFSQPIAAVLDGDWSQVSAEELRDILTAMRARNMDYMDHEGLEERISDGPTMWTMHCEDGCEEDISEPCDLSAAEAACESWMGDGEWEPESEVSGAVYPTGGKPNSHDHPVSITIDAAPEPDCVDGEEHDWTPEYEDGCRENPGVWSTGGTSMTFVCHCRHCGMERTQHTTGSQCNPGEHDTTTYGDQDPEWVSTHIEA